MAETGEVRIKVERYQRRECDDCREPAEYRFTFLLERFRSNPASSAYGRDDCSYCSDLAVFKCEECMDGQKWLPDPDGYTASSRAKFADMKGRQRIFMEWAEVTGDEAQKVISMIHAE